MKRWGLILILFLICCNGFCKIWTITNSGNTFSPATITITFGDTINFVLASVHDAREVSKVTWDANGNTAFSGGFQTPSGGGFIYPAQLAVGTHYYVCTPHAVVGMKGVIIVQDCIKPATPGSISGNTTICAGSSNTYTISSVTGATSYTWTLPTGWTGTSTTNTITTTAGTTGGIISVSSNNNCGTSAAQSLTVVVNTTPTTPGSISGNAIICAGSSNTYSITLVTGATSYTWSLPTGWTGTSTTNSITTTAGSTGGTISVGANNACGTSSTQELSVTVSSASPTTPGTISGNTTVC